MDHFENAAQPKLDIFNTPVWDFIAQTDLSDDETRAVAHPLLKKLRLAGEILTRTREDIRGLYEGDDTKVNMLVERVLKPQGLSLDTEMVDVELHKITRYGKLKFTEPEAAA